jgi:hypothetical protein
MEFRLSGNDSSKTPESSDGRGYDIHHFAAEYATVHALLVTVEILAILVPRICEVLVKVEIVVEGVSVLDACAIERAVRVLAEFDDNAPLTSK